jgi:protein tyrosine/serine phosphatase
MTESNPYSPPSRSPMQRYAMLAIFLAIVVGGPLVWQRLNSSYHLATVQPGVLYRDGARSTRELQIAIDHVQPKTVVCLVDENEVNDPAKPQFKAEFDLLKMRGIRAERVPVRLGGWPTSEDVQKFLSIAAKKENQPVLVHCAQGVRRTAMMVAAFQESVLGYDKEKAKAEILTFGHSDNTVNDIRRFIDLYDAKSQTVSPELAQAK